MSKNINSRPKFKKIYIEIGNTCNLQCSFCPEVERGKTRMASKQLEQVLIDIRDLTEQVCFHVMGEPLSHPLFSEFILLAERLSVPVEITTNGTLLKEEITIALLNPIVRQVNFSLQSFLDNFPDTSPLPYLHKIFSFTKRAAISRPDLYINYRLWNLHEADKKDEVNAQIIALMEQAFDVKINANVDVRMKKSKKIVGRLYLHHDSRFQWPNIATPEIRTNGTCHGTRSHIAIHANGDIVPCCLDKEAKIIFGNIFEKKINEILSSPRFVAMREGFEQQNLVESLCRRCEYSTRFPVSKI